MIVKVNIGIKFKIFGTLTPGTAGRGNFEKKLHFKTPFLATREANLFFSTIIQTKPI